ncbi:hypothetical protein ABID70_000788 [Clavibacter michiganensis]|uniref:hypothetical protein n=1 Tax=Clavibacter michiganensis TaxID=28447 RepID=UPI001AE679BB|nr:hypothetical protein [Clavibacter michiganensis]MBP2458231.1 hypothetical protein [Clavibacter michiganensis]MDQ0410802.1 hypothetical protein [Clavibacter michiganensis]
MTSPAPASPASDRLGSAPTTAVSAVGAPASAFVALLVADGVHLTARVAGAADRLESGAPVARYDARGASAEDALVMALALVAGGLDVRDAAQHAVDGDPAPVIQALHSLAGRGGVEPYLLRNGLTVDHFHALRDAVVAVGGRELDESQD